MSPVGSQGEHLVLPGDKHGSGSGTGEGLESLLSGERPPDKFEAEEGEDPELKHLTWVVENLQEELIRASTARQAADADMATLRAEVETLQAQVQEKAMAVSEIDDAIAEMHRQLEAQLLQKLDHQDQIRQSSLDLKALAAQIAQTDDQIAHKDVQMTDLNQQVKTMRTQQAAARKEAGEAEGGSGPGSPHSHMSSPWGTDASGSDEDETVFSVAAAARHSLAQGGSASRSLSVANEAKMRETGVTGLHLVPLV
ncbi:hypothetical protein WJX73_006322 [Symbiochloris irregularis]|uniref:Uncharacterized protein n=1 Tax=Symbiochloris irregularis TaxID=706552 RepID=A0AAW1NYW0_9CHLO